MKKAKLQIKRMFKDSIFGALFTLWTAPIDGPKLDLTEAKSPKKGNSWFFTNLIVDQRS